MHPELIPGWPLHSYGLMLVIAFYSAYFLSRRTARQAGVNPDKMLDLLLIAAVLGIVGARALYVIRYWRKIEGPLDLIAIWRGGLIFYGGLITATVGLLIYIRRQKLPVWTVADAAAPAIMLGVAFGRIGCFLNGCCWGAVCDPGFPLAVRYPRFVSVRDAGTVGQGGGKQFLVPPDARWYPLTPYRRADGTDAERIVPRAELAERARSAPGSWRKVTVRWMRLKPQANGKLTREVITGSYAFLQHLVQYPRQGAGGGRSSDVPPRPQLGPEATWSLPVHPTQLYASASGFLICGLLLLWRRWRRTPGELFALMAAAYSLFRCFNEGLRNDTAPLWGGLSLGQLTGIPILAVAIAAFIWCRTRRPTEASGTPRRGRA